MMTVKDLKAYRILEEKEVKELKSQGTILEHIKSGARIFLLSNEDDNKVFCVGFRTPPKDSTGVPHILEHSVLCGSEKFPMKDPFVELVKGSLNTFLNAMTYPDKTVYPVASCNEKDFQNLMNVYLDAVLHPNIYNEEKIFMQEGWHYEMESKDGPVTLNGVVYNEMKGAFSAPESVLDRYTRNVLFPDNCYHNESGGVPDAIPTLTYDDFLDFHRKYYHPSNSYIYLYGDMNMAEKLDWLDQEYLSHYDKQPADSVISMQRPFEQPVEKEIYYPITEDEPEEQATYLSVNTVVGDDLDPLLYVAFQILEYTLIDAPGAPLKQELLNAGIGQDIMGGYENGILQPYFSVIAKDADREQKGEFLAVVKGTLRKLADQGIDHKSLMAGINYYEFRYREADYGSSPKGLMYGLQCMDSWLYEGDPLMHLEYQSTFDFLKKAVEEGYFETLIKTYLLDNPFEAVITVSPKRNLTAEEDEKLRTKLAAYKAGLSNAEIEELVQKTRELKEYQDSPSPKEDLEKIPLLTRADIEPEAEKLYLDVKQVDGTTVLHHNIFTSGIGYIKVMFGTDRIPTEDLPYAGLLKSVLGYVDTKKHTYSDLASEIYLNTGGVSFSVTSFPDIANPDRFTGMFVGSARVLYEKLDFGFSIIGEILSESILDDEKRLGEIVGEMKSRAQMQLNAGSHSAAVARATSYFSATAAYNDSTGGIGYYEFLEKLAKNYETEKTGLIAKLKEITAKIFTADNMTISFTADDEGFNLFPGAMAKLKKVLPQTGGEKYPFIHRTVSQNNGNRNEGFTTSSQVNYVARCGTFFGSGYEYTGALKILKVILGYDYLWLNIRVKGGAYGVMNGTGRTGEGYFVSYRDPNVEETNKIFEGVPDYLEHFDADERDMTKYVIGTISDLDTPLLPQYQGSKAVSAYFSGVTDEMLAEERRQILGADREDIRKLAGVIREILKTGSLCVIGNAEQIKEHKEMFGEIKNLFN
ncbi:MAG: insulinase family protein [Clostridium sp.]